MGVFSAGEAGLGSGVPVVGSITADALVGTVKVGPVGRANTGMLSSIISQAWRAADALKFLSIPNARGAARGADVVGSDVWGILGADTLALSRVVDVAGWAALALLGAIVPPAGEVAADALVVGIEVRGVGRAGAGLVDSDESGWATNALR